MLALAAGSAACGGHHGTPSAVATAEPGQALQVDVVLTAHGCTATPDTIASGATTFAASNVDDTATSEVALAHDGVILAENEGVAPGLQGSFSLDLAAGTYDLVCPRVGAATVPVPLHVVDVPRVALTGSALARAQALAASVAGYRAYLNQQAGALFDATLPFEQAILAGDLARARQLYPAARVSYERIEPVAESFPDLDQSIDARRDDVTPGLDWAGFHRLEYALYDRDSLAGTAFYARNLVLDLSVLRARVATIPLQPAQLADGAVSLLDEVGRTKVTGEEERYSHLDLVDVQANVDGADEALTLLAPALALTDPALLAQIRSRFTTMDAALAAYRTGPGPTDFVPYTSVAAAGRRLLSADVDALAAPLSQVAALVT